MIIPKLLHGLVRRQNIRQHSKCTKRRGNRHRDRCCNRHRNANLRQTSSLNTAVPRRTAWTRPEVRIRAQRVKNLPSATYRFYTIRAERRSVGRCRIQLSHKRRLPRTIHPYEWQCKVLYFRCRTRRLTGNLAIIRGRSNHRKYLPSPSPLLSLHCALLPHVRFYSKTSPYDVKQVLTEH